MPKLPVIKANDLIKALKKTGFIHDRTVGSHMIFYHSDKHKTISVPQHGKKDLGKGLLKGILNDADLSVEELIRLIH